MSKLSVAPVFGSKMVSPAKVLIWIMGVLLCFFILTLPVIAADGLIGKIIRTGTYHSDVQIISDGNFVLDNSKLKRELGVTLTSTSKALSIIYK